MSKYFASVFVIVLTVLITVSASMAQGTSSNEVYYQYDDLGRVLQVTYIDRISGVGKTTNYSYDAAGNRLTKDIVDGAAVNAYPVANPDVVTTYENQPIIVSVLANDTDDQFSGSGPMVTNITSIPTNGLAVINAGNQTITYTPNSGFVGADTFTYEITDDGGLTSTALVSLTVYAPVTFSLSANQSAVEGDTKTFTITKTGDSFEELSVSFRTLLTGSAEVEDFTAIDTVLTFPPSLGSSTVTVDVVIADDAIWEYDDVINVELYGQSPQALLEAPPTATITIVDAADKPTYSPDNDKIVVETANTLVSLTLSNLSERPINMYWAWSNITTTQEDFCFWDGELNEWFCFGDSATNFTIPAMASSGTISKAILDDAVYEGSETFTVTFTSAEISADPVEGNSTIITIIDPEDGPSISLSDASQIEGGIANFTVSLSQIVGSNTTVDYTKAVGTAGAGDFSTASGTATITAGSVSTTIPVQTTQDSTYEGNETFSLDISNSSNGLYFADSHGIGTITDVADRPSFSISNASASEGGVVTFTVTKAGSTLLSSSVNYSTATNTAGSGDFTAASGSLTFAAGDVSKSFTVSTTEDSIFESNETFYSNLSAASGATISDSQGVGTITNDDGAPSFAINNVSVSEGNTATFTVTKSGSTALTHNVSYATAPGTAGTGDYTTRSLTALSFTAGTTTKTFTVPTTEESIYEGSETYYANLSGATNGATISDSQGVGTITNDDGAPSFAINNVSALEGNNLTFTVTKSGSTAFTHNVSYATANGSAAAGSDYVAKSGSLSFTSGQISKTIVVTGVEDAVCGELTDYFLMNLSGASNGASIGDSQGIGSITEDDNCLPVAVDDNVVGTFALNTTVSKNVLTNDSDPDGGALSVSAATCASSGCSVSFSTAGTISVTGTTAGIKTINYTLHDGNGGFDTATLSIRQFEDGGSCRFC